MLERIKIWFNRSEVIFWARFQVIIGAVWVGLSAVDLSPVLSSKYLTYWLILNGVITEYLRRRGTEYKDGNLLPMSPGDVQGK